MKAKPLTTLPNKEKEGNLMREQEAIRTITTNATFIKTAGVLASKLHIELKDARQLLLTEIWEHRYHGLQDIATTGLTNKQTRDIIFASKDIQRQQFNADNAKMKLFVSSDDNQEQVNNIATQSTITTSYSDEEINRVLTATPYIFRQANQEFVSTLLTHGEEATKEKLSMTNKAFKNNMKQLERTLAIGHEARKKADRLLKSDSQIKQEANVEKAEQFIDMIQQRAPKEWIHKWLKESLDNPFFDKAWDNGIKYQGKLLHSWDTHETRMDTYLFISGINKLIKENM